MHIEILSDESYDEFIAENDEAMIFWVAEGCIRCFEIVQVRNFFAAKFRRREFFGCQF